MFKFITLFSKKKATYYFDPEQCPGIDMMPYTGDGRATTRSIPWMSVPYRLRKRIKTGRHLHI
ncbi:hypothetical protein KTO58_21845 [Chitinophaga pendula]|uniref:hypothetical protein n=1 Tax=Chitinophaga TaxID=79328 RepID=UPI000BB09C0D|nr:MULTISPECIES: hypothetical protein [Chitinophaga]ASZ10733.1 hypothetical protein CK934_06945 [Chitinophaga sp. MD30]UCJ06290.1 hypothetical protein KTO58_21845 [Chitinophaga pendula]